MTLNIDLTNYRALIRGISSGIGRATYLNCVEITKHPSNPNNYLPLFLSIGRSGRQ